MSSRRRLFLALAVAALLPTGRAGAQQKGKPWRIGFFYGGSRQSALDTGRYPAFLEGMRELGYIEGKDFFVEARFGTDVERLTSLAPELVQSNPDVIVSSGGIAARALKQATQTVPVVIAVTLDPVGEGFVASLSRPGGNFTGLAGFLEDVFPKHIEMLKLAVPTLSRLAVLSYSRDPFHPRMLSSIEGIARKERIQVLPLSVLTLDDIEGALAAGARERAQAMIIQGSAFFVQYFRQIAGFAILNRLASIYSGREYPAAGGLMSYGPNFTDNYRRAASYVDKILKGAKPGDLPIEQPTRFEFVVNRKAAHALGISLSGELLFRADKVIE
jgi:putative tryptophan/tyrosine transport system substrate-binding protein